MEFVFKLDTLVNSQGLFEFESVPIQNQTTATAYNDNNKEVNIAR